MLPRSQQSRTKNGERVPLHLRKAPRPLRPRKEHWKNLLSWQRRECSEILSRWVLHVMRLQPSVDHPFGSTLLVCRVFSAASVRFVFLLFLRSMFTLSVVITPRGDYWGRCLRRDTSGSNAPQLAINHLLLRAKALTCLTALRRISSARARAP